MFRSSLRAATITDTRGPPFRIPSGTSDKRPMRRSPQTSTHPRQATMARFTAARLNQKSYMDPIAARCTGGLLETRREGERRGGRGCRGEPRDRPKRPHTPRNSIAPQRSSALTIQSLPGAVTSTRGQSRWGPRRGCNPPASWYDIRVNYPSVQGSQSWGRRTFPVPCRRRTVRTTVERPA